MKTGRQLIVLFICLSISQFVFAWGPDGHKIVGDIAQHYMNKAAIDSFAKYLGDTTIAQSAPWLDQARKMPEYASTGPWHYINIDKGDVYHASKDTNIVNELTWTLDKLEHRDKLTKEQVSFYLKVLVHLVGDLHMPLHTGYGSDRGGNQVTVKQYMGQDTTRYGKPFNIHGIWDGDIIFTQHITKDKCLDEGKKYSAKDMREIEEVDFVKWMNESRAYLPNVYDFKPTGIDQAYVDANTNTVEDQLYRAGLRLAHLLDEVFAKK